MLIELILYVGERKFFNSLIIKSYQPTTPIPFISVPGYDQSAHDHAAQMASVNWSPLNCTDILPVVCNNNYSNPNPVCQPPNLCCLRDPDCANITLDSLTRLQLYGWKPSLPYGAGGAVARGAGDALTAILSILCDAQGSIIPSCCTLDPDSVRSLLLKSTFYNGGFGYADADPALVKEPPYWAITFSSNSKNGPPNWTNFLTSGAYAPWFFRGNGTQFGTGAFVVTYSDGTSTNGPNSGQLFVVINGVKYQMTKINNNNQVWLYNGTAGGVDYSCYTTAAGASCTEYYFMFKQGSTTGRYPEQGNLLFGSGGACTGAYEVDGSVCANCNPGTCFKGTCVCLNSSPCAGKSPALTVVISYVVLLFSVCFALL